MANEKLCPNCGSIIGESSDRLWHKEGDECKEIHLPIGLDKRQMKEVQRCLDRSIKGDLEALKDK